MKCSGCIPKPLVNRNIESSQKIQGYTQSFLDYFTIATANSVQYTPLSSVGSSTADANTPKSFSTPHVVIAGPTTVVPGPVGDGVYGPAPLIRTNHAAIDEFDFATATSTLVNPLLPALLTAVRGDGSAFRWQLARIGFKATNVTKGADRGGMAILAQPRNKYNASLFPKTGEYMPRGIYRTFDDMEVHAKVTKENPDGFVYLDVREGLKAMHNSSTAAISAATECKGAAAYLLFSNPSGATQSMMIEVVLDWAISGAVVDGIATPHIVPASVANRVNEADAVMRAANIIPSDHAGRENVPAALALNESPAMQLAVSSTPLPRVKTTSHPVVRRLAELAGKHASKLIAAGVRGALSNLV
jgi:hypothetical protein